MLQVLHTNDTRVLYGNSYTNARSVITDDEEDNNDDGDVGDDGNDDRDPNLASNPFPEPKILENLVKSFRGMMPNEGGGYAAIGEIREGIEGMVLEFAR